MSYCTDWLALAFKPQLYCLWFRVQLLRPRNHITGKSFLRGDFARSYTLTVEFSIESVRCSRLIALPQTNASGQRLRCNNHLPVLGLGPFAVLFSTTAAAPRIYPSTADKVQPPNRFELLQVFATSPVVVFNLSCRGDDGKMLLLSVSLEYSNARIQRYVCCSTTISSDDQPSLRSERICPGWKSSIFFFWRSRIYQNKPRTSLREGAIARRWCKYGLGGCFWFLLYGVPVLLEQFVFKQEGK